MRRLSFEVLVIGAGPAGMAAAISAAQSGAGVGMLDDNRAPGGQIWRGGPGTGAPPQAAPWFERLSAAGVSLHSGLKVVAAPARRLLLAESEAGPVELHAERLVLATGARELFLPFPGWTLPGVTGAGGLQALAKGGLPVQGKRVVVAGSGPLLLAVAAYLRSKDAQVLLVAEQAPWARLAAFAVQLPRDAEKVRQALSYNRALRGIPFRAGSWVLRAEGQDRLERVTVRTDAGTWTTSCDYLACGFGLVPNLELPALLGCAIEGEVVQVDSWQQSSVPEVYCAGEVTGIGGLDLSLVEGRIAGFAATGDWLAARALFAERARARRFSALLARSFALRQELKTLPSDDTLLCRCEDVRYGAVRQYRQRRDAKLQTRCGMGPCQGRICGAASSFLFGWGADSSRPPGVPASLGTLAQCAGSPGAGEEAQ